MTISILFVYLFNKSNKDMKTENQTPEQKGRELMKGFYRSGTNDLTYCAKLALVTCDGIVNETLSEYTNDENHDRVEFYKEVKKWLQDFINLPTLDEAIKQQANQ